MSKEYYFDSKQVGENTFLQSIVPKSVVTEIRADAIDEFVNECKKNFCISELSKFEWIAEQIKGKTE